MNETRPTFAEQDATVARVAETSLRMMAGAVGPKTLRDVQQLLRQNPDAYPWQQVCEVVLAEQADASKLVNKAIVSHRDWVQQGGRAQASAAARPRRSVSNAGKRFIAMLIVRGTFYSIFAVALVAILVLAQRKWPEVDIYALGRQVEEVARGLFG